MIYPFGGHHIQRFYWGMRETLFPVYTLLTEAVKKHPDISIVVNFASPQSVYSSTLECLEFQSIHAIASIAEGVPERQARGILVKAHEKGVLTIDPATAVGIKSGWFRIGSLGGRVVFGAFQEAILTKYHSMLLAEDSQPDAPPILADSLWYKYRTSSDWGWGWGWKVWDNTVASLRQIPLMTHDILKRRILTLRYAQFLLHADQHLPARIDEQVLRWFLGAEKGEIMALSVDAWDVSTAIFTLFVCTRSAPIYDYILWGLVYPAWTRLAHVTYGQVQSLATYIQSANALFDCLILGVEPWISSTFPNTLLDIHQLHTRRQDAFGEVHFSFLVAEMPTPVSKHNAFVPQYL